MRTTIASIALAGLLGAFSAAASAAPIAGSGPVSASPDVIYVAGGCGIGWHRGPYGGCRRNIAGPVYAPRVYPGRRCRWVIGPYGGRRWACY
jgi:hypothetical protein